jgi:hypothetical protein
LLSKSLPPRILRKRRLDRILGAADHCALHALDRQVVEKIADHGNQIWLGDGANSTVFTCAMATARFLAQQKPGGTAFVIGEGGHLTALHQNGYAVVDHEAAYVGGGEGRTFNLDLVETAVNLIVRGASVETPPCNLCQPGTARSGSNCRRGRA